MAEYKLAEFRANMRKAFNEAERGEPVYIDRYGEDYILISRKNWNETMALKQQGVSTLITDEVSSDIRPNIPPEVLDDLKATYGKKNNSDSQAN